MFVLSDSNLDPRSSAISHNRDARYVPEAFADPIYGRCVRVTMARENSAIFAMIAERSRWERVLFGALVIRRSDRFPSEGGHYVIV